MSFIDCTFGNVHIYLNIYNALTRTVLELDVLRFHTVGRIDLSVPEYDGACGTEGIDCFLTSININ